MFFCLEDEPGAMNDWDEWRERERERELGHTVLSASFADDDDDDDDDDDNHDHDNIYIYIYGPEVLALKEYSAFPKAPALLEPHV